MALAPFLLPPALLLWPPGAEAERWVEFAPLFSSLQSSIGGHGQGSCSLPRGQPGAGLQGGEFPGDRQQEGDR